jgi:hypothetical protein
MRDLQGRFVKGNVERNENWYLSMEKRKGSGHSMWKGGPKSGKTICACGCGKEMEKYDKTGYIERKYIKDHMAKAGLARLGKKGQTAWNKDKRFPEIQGERNPNWKGDGVSYRNLHRWVVRYLGKASYCSKNKEHIANYYHWANISGEYKRELTDWRPLCPSCNLTDGVKMNKRFKK